jgi:hypothetical protein
MKTQFLGAMILCIPVALNSDLNVRACLLYRGLREFARTHAGRGVEGTFLWSAKSGLVRVSRRS